jgi:hypothetical protein
VEYRHLLPDDFERILDGDLGEETEGLREHLDQCAECRAEFAARSEVTLALEQLPHHSPAPLFAYRVMSQVQVFEPWHVTLRDTVRHWVPTSPAARWFAGAGALGVAMLLTLAGVWAALNSESAWLFAEVAVKRVRAGVFAGLRGVLESAFGPEALRVVEGLGAVGVALVVSAIVATALVAAIGFRAAATASRRRRS